MENSLIQIKALVIDDSRVMRNMVIKSLQETNLAEFEVTEAGNGAEALDKFDAGNVDIIFADWNMPGMNGIEFAKQVRSMSWARHIPVVMITSESGEGKQQDAFNMARITCYITKPFTVEEMRSKLEPIIEKLKEKIDGTPVATPPPAEAKPAAPAPPPPPASKGGFFSKLLS